MRALLTGLFLFPICLFAGITGNYNVKGFDPILNENYEGSAVITRANDIYTIIWVYAGGLVYQGTGVRKGDSIAFSYSQVGTDIFGVQLYEINGDRLKGPWIINGDSLRGCEILRKSCGIAV